MVLQAGWWRTSWNPLSDPHHSPDATDVAEVPIGAIEFW